MDHTPQHIIWCAGGIMIYSPLLQRQLCCLMAGAHVELAKSSFWEYLQTLATQPDKHEQTQQLLNVLPRFLHQVDESYQQYERDLELSRRSLALSTSELGHLNQALKQQTDQQQQAIRRIRKLAEVLSQRVGFSFDQKDQSLQSVTALLQHLFDSREQLGADLALSQQRCRLAIETTNLGLWDWDFDRGYIYFSDEWCSILGYSQQALKPHFESWNHLIHPDDYARCGQVLRANIKGRRELFDMEMRMRHQDGHYIWVVTRGRVTQRRTNGTALRAVGTMMDISARKAYEEALKFAKESAEQHQQSTSVLLTHMYHALKTPLQEMQTKLSTTPILTHEMASIYPLAQVMSDVLLLAQLEAGETLIQPKICDLYHQLHIWCEQYQHHHHIPLSIQISREIPKMVSVDLERIGQILNLQLMAWTHQASLHHITFGAQFLATTQHLKLCLEPTFDSIKSTTDNLSHYLTQMVQRLLRLLGGYSMPVDRQIADTTEFYIPVTSSMLSWQNWRVLGVCKHAERRQHLADGFHTLGLKCQWVDDDQQAMLELLNAALDEHSIDLVILANSNIEDQRLAAQIAESENLGQLKCVQCTDIPCVEQSHPHIHVTWSLPLNTEDCLTSLNQWVQPITSIQTRQECAVAEQFTILLVEDNTINQRLVMSFLTKAGYRVELAAHGQQAIERFEKQHFDLILMDIQMPVMGGVEATKLIRQMENQGSRVPIVAMTAHNLPGDQQRFLAYGMDGYLSKPIRFEALKQELKRVLSQPIHLASLINSIEPEPLASLNERFFDLDAALVLVDGSYDELRTLAALFINNAPRRLLEIESALRRFDSEQLVHLAYQLKGESENFGYPRVSILSGQLADLVQKQRMSELKPLLSILSSEVEHLMKDLQQRVLVI
jgi:PAS domain S-box-containing protein